MNMDEQLLENYNITKSNKESTTYKNNIALKKYSNYFGMSWEDLLEEAEKEEEERIRWKKRKIKSRLLEYRNWLQETYSANTVLTYFTTVKSFYSFHEIELQPLPTLNKKNLKTPAPIRFEDLPNKEIIKTSLNIVSPMMKAVILFISSSGCARRETLNLTISDFINATYEYHNTNDIWHAIEKLRKLDDIVPTFHIKRQKTNKYYYTFCSPEAVDAIISYLYTRENLSNEDSLFKVDDTYFLNLFENINDSMGLGKVGKYNRFRSHMLRKFHASQLYNDGLSLEIVDALQGRGKDSTHNSYFMEDPQKLKEIYMEHMHSITINLDVNNINIKSPEFVELESKYQEKETELEYYKEQIEKQSDFNHEIEKQMSYMQSMLDEANKIKKKVDE